MSQEIKIAPRLIKTEGEATFSFDDKRNFTLLQVRRVKGLIDKLDNEDPSLNLPTNADRSKYIEVESFHYFLSVKWVSLIATDSCIATHRLIYYKKKIFVITDLQILSYFRELSTVMSFQRRGMINKLLIEVGTPPCCGEFYINAEGRKVDYALMISLLYKEEVFFVRHQVPGKSLHVIGDYYVCLVDPLTDFSVLLNYLVS